ncbi:isoprenyl transferase [Candidatus Odyssella acanthamoebae]|nr:isoprenyl transferase [Candidatus Paracaedibacter acanthamoebae]
MINHKSTSFDMALETINIPQHVAIVLDGNGRWAKRQGLPVIAGHREGAQVLKAITKHADQCGVKFLTVFAFSTENWKRPQGWVDELMALLKYYLKNEAKEIINNNIKFKIIGRREQLSPEINQLIGDIENKSAANTGITLSIALSYGGRDEIVHACQNIAALVQQGQLQSDQIDESLVSTHLFNPDLPPLDLFIRTSGEMRVSNFLLWQLAYAELIFSSKLWPDFTKDDLDQALLEFSRRDRRYGATIGV